MMWWNHGSWGSGWGWILVMGHGRLHGDDGPHDVRHGAWGRMWPAGNRDEDAPERILARRLASGEIDVAEFERLRDALRRTSNSTADPAEPNSAERHPPPA